MIKISGALKGSYVPSEKMWLIQRKRWDHCWTVVLLMERKHKFDVLWEQGWPLEQTSRDDVRLFKNPLWTFSDKDISILARVALKIIFLKRVIIKNIRIFVVLKYTCPPAPHSWQRCSKSDWRKINHEGQFLYFNLMVQVKCKVQIDRFCNCFLCLYLNSYLFEPRTSLLWNRSPQYISFGRRWARHLLNQLSPRDNFSRQDEKRHQAENTNGSCSSKLLMAFCQWWRLPWGWKK